METKLAEVCLTGIADSHVLPRATNRRMVKKRPQANWEKHRLKSSMFLEN